MYFWDFENPASYNNRMGRFKTRRERDFIHRYAGASPNVAPDVGGGSGRFAIQLHDQGHHLTVLDMNETAIRLLNGRRPDIVTRTERFDTAEFDACQKYDLILAIEVLLYVEDWVGFFEKVHSLLADDGVFVFSATNRWSWRTLLQRAKTRITGAQDYGFTIEGTRRYRKIVAQSHFRVDDIDGFLWCPFGLDSDNPLVGACAAAERLLRLNRFIAQSPWLMYAVTKAPLPATSPVNTAKSALQPNS